MYITAVILLYALNVFTNSGKGHSLSKVSAFSSVLTKKYGTRKRRLKRIERFTVYGDAALNKTMCRDSFHSFKDGDFDVNDHVREGRPKTFEYAELEALLDEDLCQTQQELHPH
ncbi:hypothetical protein Trydic_g7448 [Trypoxylus dichotomus]